MRLKKSISMVLCTVMALFLAVPAMALNTKGDVTQTTNVEGRFASPTIQILVPGEVNFIVNPYRMQYSIEGKYYTDQIANKTNFLINKSDSALMVSAEVETSMASSSKMVLVDELGDEYSKEASIYLAAGNVRGFNDELEDPGYAVGYYDVYDEYVGPLFLTDNGASKKISGNLGVLEPCDPETPGDVSYMGIRFFGSANPSPDEEWKATDKVNITITWRFTGMATEYADLTVFHDSPTGTALGDLDITALMQADAMPYSTKTGTSPDYQIYDIRGLSDEGNIEIDNTNANARSATRTTPAEPKRTVGHVHVSKEEPFVSGILDTKNNALPGDSYSISGRIYYVNEDGVGVDQSFRLIHRLVSEPVTATGRGNGQADITTGAISKNFTAWKTTSPALTIASAEKKVGDTITPVDVSKLKWNSAKTFTVDKSLVEELKQSGATIELQIHVLYTNTGNKTGAGTVTVTLTSTVS